MSDFCLNSYFVLQYGQWLILFISILALYQVSSVNYKTRLTGYLVTALSRFSGAILFLFVDLFAFVIANLIQTFIALRGYLKNGILLYLKFSDK